MMASEEEQRLYWSFGYGSNMDVAFVEKSKKVRIRDHTPAILTGYKVCFNLPGFAWWEPGFGNITEAANGAVHGVAFAMNKDNADREKPIISASFSHFPLLTMDSLELRMGYEKRNVKLKAYDGRILEGFVFIMTETVLESGAVPSGRYLRILCKGATEAGLSEAYINELSQQSVYETPEPLLALRSLRPRPDELQPFTLRELRQHEQDHWISVLGYIFEANEVHRYFRVVWGREITGWLLNLFRGTPLPIEPDELEREDAFPLVSGSSLAEAERAWLLQALDFFHYGRIRRLEQVSRDAADVNRVVGYVREYMSGEDLF